MLIERISHDLTLSAEFLLKLAKTASHRYKTYEVPKKSGGMRTIHHPSRELKLIQSWIAQHVFSRFPVHDAAFAYVKGRNVLQNAERHAKHNYTLRLDFEHFFTSIATTDIIRVLLRGDGSADAKLAVDDILFITNIVCRFGRLTIGAPSSPVISNVVMYKLDREWSSLADVTYTRYADDLFFSTNTPNRLSGVLDEVRHYLSGCNSPRLTLNEEKTVFASRKRRRMVAGLILTSDGKVSLGREKKRYVKGLIHGYTTNTLSAEQESYLRGMLSYCKSVDQAFFEALYEKYGEEVITALRESS
jgi:RNA-directed DNA polymerase